MSRRRIWPLGWLLIHSWTRWDLGYGTHFSSRGIGKWIFQKWQEELGGWLGPDSHTSSNKKISCSCSYADYTYVSIISIHRLPDRMSLNALLPAAANAPRGLFNPFCLNDLCPGLHNSVKENIQPSSLLSFIVPKEVRSSERFVWIAWLNVNMAISFGAKSLRDKIDNLLPTSFVCASMKLAFH